MRYRFEKSVRILSDLIAYCHSMGSVDYHMDMKLREGISVYLISAPTPKMTQADLQDLQDILNTPRQHEVEQNYWGLSGESETDVELVLVGMMIDEAMVDFNDGVLTIVAKRYEKTRESQM